MQAKWTKHNLDDAYSALREPLKDELKNAKKNGIKNLLFATNADFRIGPNDHVGKLEDLNKGEVDNLIIYYREKLRPLIEKYPWLLQRYFGVPVQPLFVPFENYLKDSEPDLFMGVPLLGRSEDIEEVKSFARSNKLEILLIHSPGGFGKSRFLISVGELLQAELPWQSWYCRPSIRSVGVLATCSRNELIL